MTFSIRLKSDIEQRLNRLALINKRSKAFFVNESLMGGLSIDQLEEIYLQAPSAISLATENIEKEESGKIDNVGQLRLV